MSLTQRKADRGVWTDHRTWRDLYRAIAMLDSPMARALRQHLAAQDQVDPGSVTWEQSVAARKQLKKIAKVDRRLRDWVRHLVPESFRDRLPSVTSDDWQAEHDVGAYLEGNNKLKKALGVGGVGLTLVHEDGWICPIVWVDPPPKQVGRAARLIADQQDCPWTLNPDDAWLRLDLEPIAVDDRPLDESLAERLGQARSALAQLPVPGAAITRIWKTGESRGTPEPLKVSGRELAFAIAETRAVMEASDSFRAAFVDAVFQGLRPTARDVHMMKGKPKMRLQGHAAQVGCLALRESEVAFLRPWVWFKNKAGFVRCQEIGSEMQRLGWATREPEQDPKNGWTIYLQPPKANTITTETVEGWAQSLIQGILAVTADS